MKPGDRVKIDGVRFTFTVIRTGDTHPIFKKCVYVQAEGSAVTWCVPEHSVRKIERGTE